MTDHAHHPSLRGFLKEAVLQDGCPLCDERASRPLHGLFMLDASNLTLIWERMVKKEYENIPQRSSDNDHDLMMAAYAFARLLERVGLSAQDVLGLLRREQAILVVETDLKSSECRCQSYFERVGLHTEGCPLHDDELVEA